MKPNGISQSQYFKFNLYLILEHFIGIKLSKKLLHPLRRRLFEDVLKNENIEHRGKVLQNEDVICDDLEKVILDKDLLLKGPLLFKGAAKDWTCTQKWNKEYFREHFHHHQVSLVGNVGLADKENQNKYTNTNLKTFIDELGKDKNNYLRFARFIDEDPELRKDINVSWLERFKSKFARGGYFYLFMGEEGSKTDMHNAIIQSLFIQVKGKKKWTIYEPNERIFLNTLADRRPYFYTEANPNVLDDPEFPLLKYPIRYEIILDEGDVLWFPSFYWHHVQNLTENIGVTYKFTEFEKSFRVSKVLSTLFFLATKPTLIQSMYYNIFKKRDLLFEENH